eukprot:3856935-Alexandrium_andersonii.AAC.1
MPGLSSATLASANALAMAPRKGCEVTAWARDSANAASPVPPAGAAIGNATREAGPARVVPSCCARASAWRAVR